MKRRSAILSLLLSGCAFHSAYARVPLWTTPNGFVVGFNEPWIGDYRCDYYSAWLSRNSLLNMNQGVPDGTVTSTPCNDALANRQVIPRLAVQNRYAQSRSPIDMIRQGWSMSLFQA